MRKRWAPEDEVYLRRHYPCTQTKALADYFGVSERAVYNQVHRLGLKKTREYIRRTLGEKVKKIGQQHRFKPGNRPHNKEVAGWCPGGRSACSRYKPGNRPHNWMPIGTERVNKKDGTIERKVRDTLSKSDWVGVHRLVWEEHNGPVPDGYIVRFRSGDKADTRIDNLECVDMAENMRRNSVHRFPPELRGLCQLKGVLQRKINQRLRDEKQN